MPDVSRVIAWYWRYHILNALAFDNVEDAIGFLKSSSDNGDIGGHLIEVDGKMIDLYEHPHYKKLEEDERNAWKAEKESPRPVGCVALAAPDAIAGRSDIDRWANVAWFYSEEDLAAGEAEWRATYGDRVKVRRR